MVYRFLRLEAPNISPEYLSGILWISIAFNFLSTKAHRRQTRRKNCQFTLNVRLSILVRNFKIVCFVGEVPCLNSLTLPFWINVMAFVRKRNLYSRYLLYQNSFLPWYIYQLKYCKHGCNLFDFLSEKLLRKCFKVFSDKSSSICCVALFWAVLKRQRVTH